MIDSKIDVFEQIRIVERLRHSVAELLNKYQCTKSLRVITPLDSVRDLIKNEEKEFNEYLSSIRETTQGIILLKYEDLAEIFKESSYSIENLFKVVIFKIDAILVYLHNIKQIGNFELSSIPGTGESLNTNTNDDDNWIYSDKDIVALIEKKKKLIRKGD